MAGPFVAAHPRKAAAAQAAGPAGASELSRHSNGDVSIKSW